MIWVLAVAAVAGLYGLVRGGSLDGLAATQFRFVWLLAIGFIVQIGFSLWNPEWLTEPGEVVVVVGSNALVALFLVMNLRLPGMVLAAAGLALNSLVIAANSAMPVSLEAADVAGVDHETSDFGIKHEPLHDETLLPWIADVIPLPGLNTLISGGDILLAAGIAWLVYRRTIDESQAAAPEN